jgi:predicted enzyme related to lactoylglutathione lyase
MLNLEMVRDQGTCQIFRVTEEAYIGFCEHIESIALGRKVILTLVTDDVDTWYESLKTRGADLMGPPQSNPNYQIYHFFLVDPNGYWIEFQRFNQPL